MKMTTHFDHVLILINPWSTHIDAARPRIARLRQLLGDSKVHMLEIGDGPGKSSRELLAKHQKFLGSNTLLCVVGGDGTVNAVIRFLLTSGLSADAQKTILLPLWGGNANDLAHMLNGPSYRITNKELLRRGKIVPIYPLCCEVTLPDGTAQTYIASSYISFGATAMAARRLNTLIHRNSAWHKVPGGRFVREFTTIVQTWAKVSAFTVEENGMSKPIYERIFINGSRIAKLRPLPLKLTDENFYALTVKDKRIRALAQYVRELLHRPAAESTTEVTFICKDEAWGQGDGETFHVEAGAKVRVYRRRTPFYAWSTRLTPRG
jgi:hypothetical protein